MSGICDLCGDEPCIGPMAVRIFSDAPARAATSGTDDRGVEAPSPFASTPAVRPESETT